MGASEKLSVVGDIRKALQDFLAPKLGELKAKLQALSDEVHRGFAAQSQSRQEMEARLIREIKNSEEKLLLRIQLAEANLKMEQAMRTAEAALRENEQLKREKTQ